MKDQYFGDVGDYRKFSILRAFAKAGNNVLVCWMYTLPDGRSDGRFVEYLSKPEWREFEPDIFDFLHNAVMKEKVRKLSLIENSGLLDGVSFFSEVLGEKLTHRQTFFGTLHQEAEEADLVFLDPDNGIETASVKSGKKNSERYVYWDELKQLSELGKSLLIYQHFGRQERNGFIQKTAQNVKQKLGTNNIISLRTKSSFYLLIIQNKHQPKLQKALLHINKLWGEHVLIQQH